MDVWIMITKAIIPAAGLGTRFYPITSCLPKEVLPIGSFPAIYYPLNELYEAGVKKVYVITHPLKKKISDFLTPSEYVHQVLTQRNQTRPLELLQKLKEIPQIEYVYQDAPLGLGHALYQAEKHLKNEAFYVFLPDEIFISSDPKLNTAHELKSIYDSKKKNSVLGLKVAPEQTSKYGIMDYDLTDTASLFQIRGLVEKPQPEEAPSQMALPGRYLLTPEIWPLLRNIQAATGEEIQLTPALNALAEKGELFGAQTQVPRFDTGSPHGWLDANQHLAQKQLLN